MVLAFKASDAMGAFKTKNTVRTVNALISFSTASACNGHMTSIALITVPTARVRAVHFRVVRISFRKLSSHAVHAFIRTSKECFVVFKYFGFLIHWGFHNSYLRSAACFGLDSTLNTITRSTSVLKRVQL